MEDDPEAADAGPSSPVAAVEEPKKQEYRFGDHIYVGAPFEQREGGSPFMVCRIVKLYPEAQPPKVQVAYYLRRRDVTNRNLADHRVIFATFMTGIVPMSHVRMKCNVMFRDYLEDVEAFKRQDDSFVFFQIYDRFMHKPFDLIATSQISNAPDDVLAYVKANYEFVCTELGSANDLCDATRSCTVCHGFAKQENSVICSTCEKTWHLGCVDPPLTRKPALGWRWNCIKCNMALEEEEDSDENPPIIESDRKVARAAAAAKRKEKTVAIPAKRKGKARLAARVEGELDVTKWKSKDGWPYRYFGQHTQFDSIMDPHDSIYPRASTSIGTRFQALNIPGEPEETHAKKRGPPPPKVKPKGKKGKGEDGEVERGEDAAVEIFWSPASKVTHEALDAYLDEVRAMPSLVDRITVDALAVALRTLKKCGTVKKALAEVQTIFEQQKLPDYPSLSVWTATESNNFDRNISNFEDELSEFKRNLPRKTLPEIVHYYYRFKGPQRQYMHHEDPLVKDKFAAIEPSGIETEEQVTKEEPEQVEGTAEAEETKPAAEGEGVIAQESEQSKQEENSSLAGSPPPGTRRLKRFCAVCMVEEADKWYKCPDGIGDQEVQKKNKTMCESCAIQWRHYGNPKPAPTADELENRDSRDGKKKAKAATISVDATRSPSPEIVLSPSPPASVYEDGTPPPVVKAPKVRAPRGTSGVKCCVMCKRPEPKGTLRECAVCGLLVHDGCYGTTLPEDGHAWECDICLMTPENAEEGEKPHLACRCCPAPTEAASTLSALNALKPASGDGFIHLFCAIWHYELVFDDPLRLDRVQGAEHLEDLKTEKTCSLCHTSEGACVKCEGCPKWFHLSCAWSAAYRFCFEISPIKGSRAGQLPEVTFKKESGDMRPLVMCRDHPWLLPRQVYDLGQRDKVVNITAIMKFAQTYKRPEILVDFPLLKVARRAAFDADREDGVLGTDQAVAPDSFDDIYAAKPPLVRPPRKKRRKAGEAAEEDGMAEAEPETPVLPTPSTASLPADAPQLPKKVKTESQALEQPHPTTTPSMQTAPPPVPGSASELLPADAAGQFVPAQAIPYFRGKRSRKTSSSKAASVASEDSLAPSVGTSASAGGAKKRKRTKKPAFSDAENGLGSDDEVMPQASTSRSRRVVKKPVRAVKMADIVDDGAYSPLPPMQTEPIPYANGSLPRSAPAHRTHYHSEHPTPAAASHFPMHSPSLPLPYPPRQTPTGSPRADRSPRDAGRPHFPSDGGVASGHASPEQRSTLPRLPSLQSILNSDGGYVPSTDLQPHRTSPINGHRTPPIFPSRTSPVSQHVLPPISPRIGSPYSGGSDPRRFEDDPLPNSARRTWQPEAVPAPVPVRTHTDIFSQLKRSPQSTPGSATTPSQLASALYPSAPAYTTSSSSTDPLSRPLNGSGHFSSFSDLNKHYAPPPPISTSRSPDLGRVGIYPTSYTHSPLQQQQLQQQRSSTSPFISGTPQPVRTADLQQQQPNHSPQAQTPASTS